MELNVQYFLVDFLRRLYLHRNDWKYSRAGDQIHGNVLGDSDDGIDANDVEVEENILVMVILALLAAVVVVISGHLANSNRIYSHLHD